MSPEVRDAVERVKAYVTHVQRRAEILRQFADQQATAGVPSVSDSDADREEILASDLRLLLAEVEGGWKPIETAPRDELVLVFAPGTSDRWDGDLGNLICPCKWHPDAGFCVCELRDPTHWMPLPSPPVLVGGGDQDQDHGTSHD